MFWRSSKLDWSNTLGELLIVVVGVLIALAINEWNNDRLERAEETFAISRILADIQADLQDFDSRLDALDAKEESLLMVEETLAEGAVKDPRAFLRDIVIGANYGWNQGLPQRSTYDDLLGSGKLGIIRDANVRLRISRYYLYFEDSQNRVEERETAYPNLSYQLVPRRVSTRDSDGVVVDREVESGLSDARLREIVALVETSPIKDHVTAEINLARFIRRTTLDLQGRAVSLTELLEAYQAAR